MPQDLPTSVKIGCFTYLVLETDEVLLCNGRECVGLIEYELLTIKVNKNMPIERKKQTLWHEIVHGIINERLDCKDFSEEMIDKMALGIYGVLKENENMR